MTGNESMTAVQEEMSRQCAGTTVGSSPLSSEVPVTVGQLQLCSNPSQTVILRSGATKNLVLSTRKRDSSLPAVAQNDKV